MVRILALLLIVIVTPDRSYAQQPYEFSTSKDAYIIGLGVPLALFGYSMDLSVEPLSKSEIDKLNHMDVNPIDRIATYNYSERSAQLSDILIYTCLASPLTLLFSDKIRRDANIVYGMYAQALVFGVSLPLLSKGIFRRVRPYAYHPDVPQDKKLSADARKSFFSGHTSIAFTSMVFLSTVYSRYYPDSKTRPYIWAGSVLFAFTVGYLRIDAGYHYPTDVLMGAIVGSIVGYLIPKIHEVDNTNNLNHIANENSRISLFRFEFML